MFEEELGVRRTSFQTAHRSPRRFRKEILRYGQNSHVFFGGHKNSEQGEAAQSEQSPRGPTWHLDAAPVGAKPVEERPGILNNVTITRRESGRDRLSAIGKLVKVTD